MVLDYEDNDHLIEYIAHEVPNPTQTKVEGTMDLCMVYKNVLGPFC